MYLFLVLGREGPFFVKEHSDSKSKYSEVDIINMLVDNIFVVFDGKVFQQIVGISMGINRAPLLADIFRYSYEAEFIKPLLSAGTKQHLSSTSHIDTSMKYCQSIIQILRILSCSDASR